MAFSAADRDAIIRTVIGEAGNEPDSGKAAVAHVILNRVASGGFGGRTVPGVVFAKHQFEPWNVPEIAAKLRGIAPESKAYQQAAAVVDQVLGGALPDPTGGATHFLAPGVMKSRGAALPGWAQGTPLTTIGGHAFFRPGGGGSGVAPQNALAAAVGATPSGGAPAASEGTPAAQGTSPNALLAMLSAAQSPAATPAPTLGVEPQNSLAALRVRAPRIQLPVGV